MQCMMSFGNIASCHAPHCLWNNLPTSVSRLSKFFTFHPCWNSLAGSLNLELGPFFHGPVHVKDLPNDFVDMVLKLSAK